MRQDFATEDFKAELERGLGFRLRSLKRLDGASALNFKAVRETDGLAFAVKCSPPPRMIMFTHLVRHLEETKGTKAVSRLFERECPANFRGYDVICLSWCEGERRFPDELSEPELLAFLDDYLAFSAAMQKATLIVPPDPIDEWRRKALENARGFFGGFLRKFIEREIPAEETRYDKARLGVIHGDFHHGNFLFAAGKVNGFFDLEEFCGGYPADDIVRYFVCAVEHLKFYEFWRRRKILKRFAAAAAHLPYPARDWRVAINGLLIRKIYRKTCDKPAGLFQTVNLLFRSRFYLSLRALCAE